MKKTSLISLIMALVLTFIAVSACAEETATLYIGTKDTGFSEYPAMMEGEMTPDALIADIQELTGWDLTLAEPVTTGKGGMSVCFASNSAIFVGPSEPQNPEFQVIDAVQLAQTILDSVQKTLQMNFTTELGDPDALDIFYFMEGDQPLTLENIGRSWPIDEPYQW